MSKVIDERVVEMRFDNKDFESNVQTSLKTIDKLKDSLNFEESTRSVEKFQDSLKRFSLDDIGQAVESLSDKFNWGNVFKMELLSNVVDSIYSTITGVFNRIKGELHLEDVDPISNMIMGWGKYAEKTQSVATIMAATGESMEFVNDQMEKLLYFTDETSYSFTDMAGNIGKFTANGVELETASSAMQGIATWAARSGQNAGTASRVMYNLSQAIGMGALKLQDWKSVELANMGTKEFKEMAIAAGLATGALIKNEDGIAVIADETAGTLKETQVTVENFRETLKDGWLDTNTLLSTLNEYGKASELIGELHEATGLWASEIIELAENEKLANMSTKEFGKALGMTEEEVEGNEAAIEELRESFALLASQEYAFSLETYKAAQEARTFGDAMAAVADAVSSGWMKTFELLFGGYEKAKVLWTDLATNLSEIFNAANADRNALLEEANLSGYDKFVAKLEEADIHLLDIERVVSDIVGKGEFRSIVDTAGSFEEAIKKGYISAETLKQAIAELPGSFTRVKQVTEGLTDDYEQMTEWSWELRKGMYGWDEGHDYQVKKLMEAKGISEEYAERVVTLSEKHEELGRELTKEEAAAFLTYTELTSDLEETITLTDDLRDDMAGLTDEITKAGMQEALVNGLMNIGHIALEVFMQVREAIKDMFPPATAARLRDLAIAFEQTSAKILKFIEDSKVVKNVVTALIFPFRVIYDVISAAFKLLVPFGNLILLVLSPVIGLISAFGGWLNSIKENSEQLNPFAEVIYKVADALGTLLNFVVEVAKRVGDFVKNKLIEKFSEPLNKLIGIFSKFKEDRLSGLDKFIDTIKKLDAEAAGNKVISFLSKLYHLAGEVGKAFSFLLAPFKTFSNYYKIIDQNARGLTTYQKALKALKYTAQTTLSNIENSFKKLGINITPVKEAISGFIDLVTNKFNSIKEKIAPIIEDFKRRFSDLKLVGKDLNIFEVVFLSLEGTLAEFGITLDGFKQKLRDIRKSIRDFFMGSEDDTNQGFFANLSEKFTSAKKSISDFFSGFKLETEDGKNVLQTFIDGLGITLPKVLKGAGIALAGGGLFKLIKTLKESKEKKGGNLIGNLIDSLNPFSEAIETVKTATSSFNIVGFAIGIGLLSGALIALSYVPADKLKTSLGTIGASLAGFIGTIAAVNKVMGDKGTFRLVGMGLGMIAISASLLLFAKAINAFKEIDIGSNSDIQKILGGLLLATLTMKTIAKSVGKNNFKLSGGLGLIAMAASLLIFAKSLEKFANLKIDEGSIGKVIGGLFAAIVTFGAIAGVAGHFEFKLSNGLAMMALGITLLAFASVVKKLGNLEIGQLVKGIVAVGILTAFITASLWFLADASRAIGGKAGLGQFAMLIGLSVAMLAFGAVAALLGFLPIGTLLKGVGAVAALGVLVTAMMLFIGSIGKTTGLRGATSAFIMLTGIVLAVVALAAVVAVMGVLDKPIKKGIDSLLKILAEVALAFLIIKQLISPNIKGALLGVLAIAGFGVALIPMVYALSELGKLKFDDVQKNMILLGELFLAFLALVGITILVGTVLAPAAPILLAGAAVMAGAFALFIAGITVLVKDLERLEAIDSTKAKEGLECIKEELKILTDLAHQFMEEEGLFKASLQAAKVCRKFGAGLHELAEDTLILGFSNATQARESLKVVQEEIDLMIALGERINQNEGLFGQAINASVVAFSFGVGLHGLANDTRILGLANAENAKAAIEPLTGLISLMISLAETIGTDVSLFGKAILVTADMVLFGMALLPLVGAEFVVGLVDAKNVTSNMSELVSLIQMFFELAEKVGADAALYFSAKATAEAIKDFGYALIPLVASEFLSQFVDAEASSKGFQATKEIVEWLIDIAKYFQGEDSINKGAGAAVDRLNGFAKSLAKLTVTDFFSQFVDADRALEGLKPVQSVVDMLVGMARDLSSSDTMTTAAETAVESVKTFGQSLNDIMWSLSSNTWEAVNTTIISDVIDAIVDGLLKISAIGNSVTSIAPVLQSISDMFTTIESFSSSGIFGKKKMDTSSITDAFASIGTAVTDLAATVEQADVGNKLINSIVIPLTEGSGSVIEAIMSIGTAMSNTLLSFENSFYVDGNNLAVGFVNGIYSRVQDAYNAGFQLASDAEKGTRDAGEIKSPSKVFTKLGEYVGEGFVGGIESQYSQITAAAQGMIDRAVSLASELKERLRAILAENDNEFHITPVMDMDDTDQLSNLSGTFRAARSIGSYNLDTATVNASVKSRGYDSELRSLLDQVAKLGDHIDNMQMVLDTGVLVGATSAKMDSQFGVMTMRRGRGN